MSEVTTETPLSKKFDPEAFAMNLARAMESSGQALAAFLKPRFTILRCALAAAKLQRKPHIIAPIVICLR